MGDIEHLRDEALGKMPGHIYMGIRNYLDGNADRRDAFLAGLSGVYSVSSANNINDTAQLILHLDSRGMTIGEFSDHAAQLRDQELVQLCGLRVQVTLREFPREEVVVFEGGQLRLSVAALGYPLPQYQWMQDGRPLPGANHSTYSVPSVSADQGGVYTCELFDGHTRQPLGSTPPSVVLVYKPAPLEITVHPRFCRTEMDGTALFCCRASQTEGVTYQWCKDDELLHDSETVQGAQSSELRLLRVDGGHWQGCYHCIVSCGHQQLYSQGAPLHVVDFPALADTAPDFTATDKVALLIGCSDYRGARVLNAPRFDVETLAAAFQSLNFKVVSLLDLTSHEMLSAVHKFKELVGPGVYCVFYFCGHGFESAHNGLNSHCSLVPVDAPIAYNQTHCVSANWVFSVLLERDPAVCCMILDICRKIRDDGIIVKTQPDLGCENQEAFDISKGSQGAGKSIVCYGTCFGMSAFEDKTYGIFVSHLKNFLTQRISIEQVFEKLREALGRDPRVHNEKHTQVAEVKSSLIEPRRSFCDRIVYKGFTEQYNRNREIWERSHMKPEPQEVEIEFPGFTVKATLTFQKEFSNVLKIFVTVTDPAHTEHCTAYVSEIPVRVTEKARTKSIPSPSNSRICNTYVCIKNIQQLREDMEICVACICTLANGRTLSASTDRINLDFPLVASLQLWQELPPLAGRRVAVEQNE